MFTAFYDRALEPPTFDVVSFLQWLEYERLQRGENIVAIEVLPGPRFGFAANGHFPVNLHERQAMWDRVAVPMMRMLPSLGAIMVHSQRSKLAGVKLSRFEYFLRSYRAGIRPLRPRRDKRPIDAITMTLRESSYWPTRNSRIGAWLLAARLLQREGREVIIVRDTERADEPLPGLTTAPAASVDLEERAMLYRSAAANLFVSNGPAWFALAIDAPATILRPATDGAGGRASTAALRQFGLADGLPNAPKYQRLLWLDDTALNIVTAAKGNLA